MLCNDIAKFVMYIAPPIDVIPIGRVGKPGKQSELQMIMRIDKARHHQKSVEVNSGGSRSSGPEDVRTVEDPVHSTSNDFYGSCVRVPAVRRRNKLREVSRYPCLLMRTEAHAYFVAV